MVNVNFVFRFLSVSPNATAIEKGQFRQQSTKREKKNCAYLYVCTNYKHNNRRMWSVNAEKKSAKQLANLNRKITIETKITTWQESTYEMFSLEQKILSKNKIAWLFR